MDASLFVGLFNVFVGLMLVAACLLMGGGFVLWFTRLGAWPSYRDDAIHYMQWAVATLFTLVLILSTVKLVQSYPDKAMFVLGVVIVISVIVIGIRAALGYYSASDEDDHH